MKLLMALALTLATTQAFAAEDLGKKIEFFKQNGHNNFGVHSSKGFASVIFSFNGYEVVQHAQVKTISARILNVKTQAALNDWTLLASSSSGSGMNISGIQMGQIFLEKAPAALFTNTTRDTVIQLEAILKDGTSVKAHIDFGSYCLSSPGNFINLDTGASGCSK